MSYEEMNQRIKELEDKECMTKEDRQEVARLHVALFEMCLTYN